MKTPIAYYGGKQNLVQHLLPLIGEHSIYIEPFCGGAALFWQKESAKSSVLNDTNKQLINFYKVLQNKDLFSELKQLLTEQPYSRYLHNFSAYIYKNPRKFSKVQQAWALWNQCNNSYLKQICNGWRFGKLEDNKEVKKHFKNIDNLREKYVNKLKSCYIECKDAISIIKNFSTGKSLIYCDPPYIDTDMGHYTGYTEKDYIKLLDHLSVIEGKFILSSFPNEYLNKYIEEHRWHKKQIKINSPAKNKHKGDNPAYKIEVIASNFIKDKNLFNYKAI